AFGSGEAPGCGKRRGYSTSSSVARCPTSRGLRSSCDYGIVRGANKDTGQTAHGTGLLTSSAPSRGADLASRRDPMHQELARGGVRQNDASIPHGPCRPGRWISALGRERDRPAATELAAPHLSVARAEAAAARACHVVSGAPS